MSNRKYSRLAEGYHDRSQYHPYQTGSNYSSKSHSNCVSDGRDRSPNSGSGSRGSSPYSARHSNDSPRLIRSKSSHSRSRESGKKGSNKSPGDSVTHSRHSNNSHSTEQHGKFNHVNEDFPWSQHTSSSGKPYYYNCKTEKSQWEKPREWIERENREKERRERDKKEVLLSREPKRSNGSREFGYTTRDTDFSRNANLSKLGRSASTKKDYASPSDGRERRPDTHQIDSRTRSYSDDSKKGYNSPSTIYISDGRGHSVVKTSSANTVALSTTSHRTGPVAASLGGESTVSPAGSVQDVSPPSTPSSRPGSLEPIPHSSSPQLLTTSPLVAQFHASQSPHLHIAQKPIQQYNSRQPNVPVQNVFPQTAVSNCPMTIPTQYTLATQQSFIPQRQPMAGNLGQYTHVNESMPPLQQPQHPMSYANNSVQVASVSPQPCQPMFENQVRQQPVLHPLQQATLLQQRQMLSEAQHNQPAVGNNFHTSYSPAQALASHHHSAAPTVTRSSVLHQVKELEQKPHNACSSPMSFAHGSAAKEQCLPPLTSITNSQLLPGSSVPAPSQPSPPVVNLQSLAKYTDKSFTNLTSGWPVELIEKQVQRCWDDSTCYLSESTKTSSDHLETQSQLAFMELRLDVGTRRISHLKEMSKTLEVLLEDSDAKSLM